MGFEEENEACGRFIQKMKQKYGQDWSPLDSSYVRQTLGSEDLPKGIDPVGDVEINRFKKPDMRPKPIVEPEKVLDENGWLKEEK